MVIMIQKIKVANYKKFQDEEEFNFKEGVNVLIGLNNAGKTTLLELIYSFLNHNPKFISDYYNELEAGASKPNIEVLYDDETFILDTSKKTFKWSYPPEMGFGVGFIGAKDGINYIEKSLNNVFGSMIKANTKIHEELVKVENSFQESMDNSLPKTTVISDENDEYKYEMNVKLEKAATIDFSNTPNSIVNKGLGQQKEFLIKYFSKKNSILITNYLIIDEFENSLSIYSIRKMMKEIISSTNGIQFFISTHNYEVVGNGEGLNVITVGDTPVEVVKEINDIIWCEGKEDRKRFSNIWPDKIFMQAGGSGIIDNAQTYQENNRPFKAIVDGDSAGRGYRDDIQRINPTFSVHKLLRGCIEDYWEESAKESAYEQCNLSPPNPIPSDCLHKSPVSKETRDAFKKAIKNSGDIDDESLYQELNTFISTS